MRKVLIITAAALLALALAAPSSSATTSLTSTFGGKHTTAVMPQEDLTASCVVPCVTYQVRTPNGWGTQKSADIYDLAGPKAGCDNCELEAIRAVSNLGVGYKVRTQNGWGTWRSWPEAAGCFGCVIQAIQLSQTTNNTAQVDYRVQTDGGWGNWRSAITQDVAGCIGCTVHYIQMRITWVA